MKRILLVLLCPLFLYACQASEKTVEFSPPLSPALLILENESILINTVSSEEDNLDAREFFTNVLEMI